RIISLGQATFFLLLFFLVVARQRCSYTNRCRCHFFASSDRQEIMATIRLNRQAAHAGQLPRVCICCGEPAQQLVQHTFRFEPTWLILLLTLFPKMWVFFSYDTFHLSLPVCSSHTTRFKWPSYAG